MTSGEEDLPIVECEEVVAAPAPSSSKPELALFSNENAFDVGLAPFHGGAIVLSFPTDPPQTLAFVGQACEKFFAQVMEAGFVLWLTFPIGEEEILGKGQITTLQ